MHTIEDWSHLFTILDVYLRLPFKRRTLVKIDWQLQDQKNGERGYF